LTVPSEAAARSGLLQLDVHAARDFQGQVLFTDLYDLARIPPVVVTSSPSATLAIISRAPCALVLGADDQEIKHRQHQERQHHRAEEPLTGRAAGGLRMG